MSQIPTIYDIARKAGVGIATVSRVINGHAAVSPSTRLMVQQAMAELGYRPSRAARRLSRQVPARPRVAVLLPFFTAAFYFAVTRALARELMHCDTDVALFDIEDRAAKLRVFDQLVTERSCDGLVLVSCGLGPERQAQLSRLGLPAVAIDRHLEGMPCAWIDNRVATRTALAHLRARGARRIAFIGIQAQAQAIVERKTTFLEMIGAQAPLRLMPAIEKEGGRVAAAELLDEHPDLDAFFCANDILALGCLQELRHRGLAVPGLVQVMGFDDQPLMDLLDLTTMRQPMTQLGNWAAQAIHRRITRPIEEVPSKCFPVDLVIRGTTRP